MYKLSIIFLIFALFNQMLEQMNKQMQDMEINQKSVELTASELRKLKNKFRKSRNKQKLAEGLGLRNRGTLARIISFGSGSSENIAILRSKLG
jgi:hypothetical protein